MIVRYRKNAAPVASRAKAIEVLVANSGGGAEINFSADGGGWTIAAMQDTGTGWWRYQVPSAREIEFNLRLNGTDWYPGGVGKNFRAACERVYLRDGILFPYDPATAAPAGDLSVLTLNLHCYQETGDQDAIFDHVANVIAAGKIDLAVLEEAAQQKNLPVAYTHRGVEIRTGAQGNMVAILADRLRTDHGEDYDWFWNWAHYGFTDFEEGVAVLGRTSFGLAACESRLVSSETSPDNIDTRLAVRGVFDVPGIGPVHLFGTHLSWGAPRTEQIANLKAFAGVR